MRTLEFENGAYVEQGEVLARLDIATEPLTVDEAWTHMARRTLLVFDAGLPVAEIDTGRGDAGRARRRRRETT